MSRCDVLNTTAAEVPPGGSWVQKRMRYGGVGDRGKAVRKTLVDAAIKAAAQSLHPVLLRLRIVAFRGNVDIDRLIANTGGVQP